MEFSLEDFCVLGLNHTTCPVEIRENLSFTGEQVSSGLCALLADTSVTECFILSTCNRTEIYFFGGSLESVLAWLVREKKQDISLESSFIYNMRYDDAVKHLFKVASGLDSMVLGETQILGQLKNSYRVADENMALGPLSRLVLESSFTVAKTIRTTTNIGSNSISLPAAGLKVAKKIFGDLSRSAILFIGAGEMIRYCAEYFTADAIGQRSFSNRTLSRADDLARHFGGDVISIEEARTNLDKYDIIVSCTSSAEPVLNKQSFVQSSERRKRRPVLVIDLAVPRDVDASVTYLSDVFIYTIDDLGRIVQDGLSERKTAAALADKFIEKGLASLLQEISRRSVSSIIRTFREYGKTIAHVETEKARHRLSNGARPEDVISQLSKSITNKMLHDPCHILGSDLVEDKDVLVDALIKLYGLNRPK